MKLSKEELEDFQALYDYLKINLLGYKPEMKLSSLAVSRIYGTVYGTQFYRQKKKNKENGEYNKEINLPVIYSFKVILATLIFHKAEIIHCLETMRFKNEAHRINTIFKIVDDNINGIKMMIDKKKEVEEKLNNADLEYLNREVQPYNQQSQLKEKFKEYL